MTELNVRMDYDCTHCDFDSKSRVSGLGMISTCVSECMRVKVLNERGEYNQSHQKL
jgi:hypothetical protein